MGDYQTPYILVIIEFLLLLVERTQVTGEGKRRLGGEDAPSRCLGRRTEFQMLCILPPVLPCISNVHGECNEMEALGQKDQDMTVVAGCRFGTFLLLYCGRGGASHPILKP
eukprot:scaffold258209_cov14-Tisochrysis_lutea.AAC.1